MKRAWVLGLSLTLSSTALASEPGLTKTDVKLGETIPLSGPYAFYGDISRAARAYFEQVNAAGGVHGRKINLVVEDDAFNPTKTVPATRKLVEREKVFAMFSSLGFAHGSVAKYLQQKKVPTLYISDGGKTWDDYSNGLRGALRWYDDGRLLGEYVAKAFPGKKVGFLYENTSLGQDGMEGAKAALGDKVVIGPAESFNPGDPNVDSQTLSLMNAKVDVVIANATPPAVVSAAKLAHQKGWKPQWVASFVVCDPVLVALGGPAVEGMVSHSLFKLPTDNDPAVEAHKQLLAKYASGTQPSPVSIYGQALAEFMVHALKDAGPEPTRASLLKAARNMKPFTCSVCLYPSSTTEQNPTLLTRTTLMKLSKGKWSELKQ